MARGKRCRDDGADHGNACRRAGNDVPIAGVRDFGGARLHILQIGLGTFGTFIDNLARDGGDHPAVSWLLSACSDSTRTLRGVGVEPVLEHIARLGQEVQKLPNASLVQAAIGSEPGEVKVYGLSRKAYERYLAEVPLECRQAFDDAVLYLRNMSCVGQKHPEIDAHNDEILERFGVRVETEAMEARVLSYGDLARRLHFRGCEVLLIDAEGYDVRILRSMLAHLQSTEAQSSAASDAWPDLIQFESMGTCDKVDGPDSEVAVVQALEDAGYQAACHGKDTQLVRRAALVEGSLVQAWADTLWCEYCGCRGVTGMPYINEYCYGNICYFCEDIRVRVGPWLLKFVGCWELVSGEERGLRRLATDGSGLWALDERGDAWHLCEADNRWEPLSFNVASAEDAGVHELVDISLTSGGALAIAVNARGQVLCFDGRLGAQPRDVQLLSSSPAMRRATVSADGRTVLGIGTDDAVYQLSVSVADAFKIDEQSRWRRLYDCWLRQVSISADGSEFWGVNEHDEVYHSWDGESWTPLAGHLQHIAVSPEGRNAWGVNAEGRIYYSQGAHGDWVHVPGSLRQLCVANHNDCVWGLDRYGKCWSCCAWSCDNS
eukprot:TRINITY_DN1530_c0_g2_i1.p1 TRINITY_DN1530_c0_g2~~TRINITY_DN1530_c0_g2_i1.p1  ORF type:complete len:604 (-),score=104.13 TRINITY_DN1530_c0_g2_i1:134-1945(-)